MMSFLKRIKENKSGVALFIVLAAMATLSIFVGEITYTAQINQKLAYDRLDQIKAHALAKSGLRLGLLRIKAYAELKKTVGDLAKSAGASAAAVSSAVPKAILEKIWSEPITIPFTGDISGLPTAARDPLLKFRKDSGMEGKLYISIQAQSSRFNLNSHLAAFAASNAPASGSPTPTPSPVPATGGTAVAAATATPTPAPFNPETARQLLTEQLRQSFQKKFEEDQKFRDQYSSFRIEDLADEIVGWSDLTYESLRAQQSSIPFKKAPFYDISELHYLPSIDDDLYNLLAPQFNASANSEININLINDEVLKSLVPQMTTEERKKFFAYRDQGTDNPNANTTSGSSDGSFKDTDEFYKYLKGKVNAFGGSDTKINDFKTALVQRGVNLVTDESNFIIHIEATVQQTKRTLEAMVSLIASPAAKTSSTGTSGTTGAANPTPTPAVVNGLDSDNVERSNLKITQLRFL